LVAAYAVLEFVRDRIARPVLETSSARRTTKFDDQTAELGQLV